MPECPHHPGVLLAGAECRWCRAGITDDTKGRLVICVADAAPWACTPTAVIEACAVCLRPAYVDRVTTPDPPGEALALVCVACALENPETRPQAIRMMTAAERLGSFLPPAAGRGKRHG